ncbi:hypothetical protein CDL12_03927 [Handroanthus impetiginosus]|uniref:Mitochondrial transcription termination factor, mTERF n=1 Tax=Handroanthus impetiginosus TaxID=429701 RepID=A0A2G9I0Q0_9LAMI|nr:hypothetical protein CDL12_03927 [Handroanthus impetiginosus]
MLLNMCGFLFSDQSKPDPNQIRMPDSASVATSKLLINVNPAIYALPNALRVNRVTACRNWELHSTAQVQDAVLSDDDEKTWDSCRQALSAYGFANNEQDKILGKAFGQIHSPYWGEERKKEVPKFEIVSEILSYLKDLSLTDDDLSKLLKKFPEVLGCSLENELKPNVQILEKEWGIKGKTLRNLLLRNPKVLGYNIDCKGDCMAQCTRCWARF